MAKQSSLGGDIVWVIEVAWCVVRSKQQEEGDWRVTVGKESGSGAGKGKETYCPRSLQKWDSPASPRGISDPQKGSNPASPRGISALQKCTMLTVSC